MQKRVQKILLNLLNLFNKNLTTNNPKKNLKQIKFIQELIIKLFFRLSFLNLSGFFAILSILVFFFPGLVYDFYNLDINSVNEIGKNQLKTDIGGVWLLVTVLPILFLITKKDYYIDIMILFFVVASIARGISFLTGDGYHPLTIGLFLGEILWIFLLTFFKRRFPDGSFFR